MICYCYVINFVLSTCMTLCHSQKNIIDQSNSVSVLFLVISITVQTHLLRYCFVVRLQVSDIYNLFTYLYSMTMHPFNLLSSLH